MHKNKIKAVLFDLGETLLTFSKLDINALFKQGAHLTYDYLKQNNQPTGNFTIYYWLNLIAVRLRYLLSFITKNDFDSLDMLKKIGSRKSVNLTPQQWEHLAWLWYEPLSKLASTEPNLIRTLQTLKQAGLKLAVVSNTFVASSSLDKQLKQVGILDFFDFTLYSYQLDFRKPDPRIFEIAARKIGEKPQNILFVGDRIDNDIIPAMKAGMTAALKINSKNNKKKTPPAALKINQISDLPSLIAEINQKCSASLINH